MTKRYKEDFYYRIRKFWPFLKNHKIIDIILDSDKRNEIYIRWNYAETKVSFGEENTDKTFYVIRHSERKGLFSLLNFNIAHLYYAEENGYIPIIDERSFCNFMSEDSMIGKVNVWDMFLEQPAGYKLKDIKNSKNVIFSNALASPGTKRPYFNWRLYRFGRDSKRWNHVFQKYYHFLPQIEEYIEEKRIKIFGERKRILGVSLRRGITRVISLGEVRVNRHPAEKSVKEVIEIVKKSMEIYHMQYVFCSTDADEVIKEMEEVFGEKLLYLDRERSRMFNKEKPIVDIDVVKDRYSNTLSYITEIMLLSKCDMLVAGRNGGSIAADIFNNGNYLANIQTDRRKMFDGGNRKMVVKDNIVYYERAE